MKAFRIHATAARAIATLHPARVVWARIEPARDTSLSCDITFPYLSAQAEF